MPRNIASVRTLLAAALLIAVLTVSGCLTETSWSPDGKALVYGLDGKLQIYDVQTKQSRLLDTGKDEVVSAAWSPDGSAIAYYAVTRGKAGGISLNTIEPASGRTRTLVARASYLPVRAANEKALTEAQQDAVGSLALWGAAAISWSPDSKRIAFVSAHPGGSAIEVSDYPEGALRRIGQKDMLLGLPSWSPDGRRLAYVSAPDAEDAKSSHSGGTARRSLWLYDPATATQSKVCDTPGQSVVLTPLQWSSDSTRIGFVSAYSSGQPFRHEDAGLACVVPAQPGAVIAQRITGITGLAAWSPGLTKVACLEARGEGPDTYALILRGVRPVTRRVVATVRAATRDNQDLDVLLPAFSPDGCRIAVPVTVGEHEVRIETFTADSGAP